jgi:hypothetical protein
MCEAAQVAMSRGDGSTLVVRLRLRTSSCGNRCEAGGGGGDGGDCDTSYLNLEGTVVMQQEDDCLWM